MAAPTWTPCTVTLGTLKPWAANPRLSTKAQAKRILASFAKFGQVLPVAIGPDSSVYDGHQRLSALLTVHGPSYEIDARRSSRPLTDEERRALVVTLHAGAVGAWNWDDLAGWDAAQLGEWGMDADALKQWNTDAAALATMLEAEKPPAVDAEPQIDRAEELRVKWGVEPGQLWRLGEHRLICGDCTDRAVVERVMGGEIADCVFTDPPYNVSYQDNESVESLKARNRRTDGLVVSNDSMTDDEFFEFLKSFLGMFPLKPGGAFYLCAPAGRTETQFRNALDCVSGLVLRECIVWVKDRFVFGRQDYHWRHESILYGWKNGAAHYFVDDHKQDTVWEIKRPSVSEFHPTTKPVEIPTKAISNSTQAGEIVWEPFSGSGTTIIACERLGRRCRAVEISPAYVAVALERWAAATGGTPEAIEA